MPSCAATGLVSHVCPAEPKFEDDASGEAWFQKVLRRSRLLSRNRASSQIRQPGWTRIGDDNGHIVFFNYAFNVLVVDALPRNCYVRDGGLLPFDVILCHPTEELEQFLKLY